MELSFSRSRDHNWKIPASNGPIYRGHVTAMGIAILVLALLHSALDFSLQLPGLALFFAAALAPLASISLARTRRSRTAR